MAEGVSLSEGNYCIGHYYVHLLVDFYYISSHSHVAVNLTTLMVMRHQEFTALMVMSHYQEFTALSFYRLQHSVGRFFFL